MWRPAGIKLQRLTHVSTRHGSATSTGLARRNATSQPFRLPNIRNGHFRLPITRLQTDSVRSTVFCSKVGRPIHFSDSLTTNRSLPETRLLAHAEPDRIFFRNVKMTVVISVAIVMTMMTSNAPSVSVVTNMRYSKNRLYRRVTRSQPQRQMVWHRSCDIGRMAGSCQCHRF